MYIKPTVAEMKMTIHTQNNRVIKHNGETLQIDLLRQNNSYCYCSLQMKNELIQEQILGPN